MLVGSAGRRIDVPRRDLPAGAGEGTWLEVEFAGSRLVSGTIDEEEAARARQRIREKLERLRRGEHRKP